MPVCNHCHGNSFIRDDITESLVCSSCGQLQEFDSFRDQYGGINGPTGTFVRVGTTGAGNIYNYKDTKIYEAKKLIDDLSLRLGLSVSKTNDVKTMVATITEGEYGQGNWFTIFIGACAYVAMRRDNKSLPIAEVASVIGYDVYELGRMIMRVVNFLDLKKPDFPEFDIVNLFVRTLRNSPRFAGVGGDKVERMQKQGIFLIHCAIKWYLTTGRRPLPMVAAVLVLVAELNGLCVKIEDLAKEVHAVVHTCRLRYRELLEALVKVAQAALPWGKDVTVKNVVKNAPFVIQYMEKKSMAKPGGNKKDLEGVGLDLGDVVNECLRKDIGYGTDVNFDEDDSATQMDMLKLSHDCQYFEVEDGGCALGVDDIDRLKLSHECLSMVYSKFLEEVENVKSSGGLGEVCGRKKRQGFELRACTEWWKGKSELSKKLILKKILEKDVGLDAMPPSFVAGCKAYMRRREKINAAKVRIDRIMHPSNAHSGDNSNTCISEEVPARKKRKRTPKYDIDWEDLIIETLLLHRVKEEEIEKGYYNTLLELYVFDSGIV